MSRPNRLAFKKLDERRFRFRVRFERALEGAIVWKVQDNIVRWLDERLGRGNYAYHGSEEWEGHGRDCFALHLDDHTVIPDLLTYSSTMRYEISRTPRFVGQFTRQQAQAIREALSAIQTVLVDRLNAQGPRVSFVFGRCDFLPKQPETIGERMAIARASQCQHERAGGEGRSAWRPAAWSS